MSAGRKQRGGVSFRAPDPARPPRPEPFVPDMPGISARGLAVALALTLAGAFAGALLLIHLVARLMP